MTTLVLIAALVFTVPGASLGWISGLRLPWALAASIPVTFGLYGLAGWVLGQLDIRFDWLTFAVFWALCVLPAGLWRGGFLLASRRRARRAAVEEGDVDTRPTPWWRTREGRRGGILDPAWILPFAGVATGAWLIIDHTRRLFEEVPHGLGNIVQGWDVHWHASMVRWFMDAGIGDPTRMGELRNIETGNDLYYPSAWHIGAGLAGEAANISPIEALNLTSMVLPGMLLPLSAALIAWKLIGRVGLTAQIAAGIAGIAVFASPVLMWIGTYTGMWPYLASMSAVGVVIALFMHVPYRPVAALAAMLAFTGLVQMHPAPVTVVVMVLALWWLLHLVWAPSRRPENARQHVLIRLQDLGWLALSGGLGVLILLPQLLSGSEATEEVSSFSAVEDVTRQASWDMAIHMQTRHSDFFPHLNQTLLLWLAGGGAIALLLWRRNLWGPLFWFLSVALTANALLPFDNVWGEWLAVIGNLHYSTAHRLVMPVALFTFAAAAVGVAVLVRLLALAPLRMRAPWTQVSLVVSLVLALGAGWGTTVWATRDTVLEGLEPSMNGPRHDDRMVSEADIRAFDWLAKQPGAYEGTIFGEPADGHGWMYAYNGLPSVMRHYLWPHVNRASDTDLLYWHPNLIGVGNHGDPEQENNVDKAATRMGVKYYFVSPWSFWGFQDPRFEMIDGLWETPGVTPVYRDLNVAVFAVNQAFSDEELQAMRAPGNSPEELPPLTLDATGNPTFHRPTKPDSGGDAPVESPGNPALDQPPVEIPATRP
ncbi:DUF6541 family protein [Corynebacterium nasicanis]|uniref:DUF6541 family protein n=1 Tax=Corynebacterium nasicanis TaxID=1448267 RepID=A0ABW1QDB8_9CORY